MGLRAFLRPLAYKILARDQDPDSFLDRITGIIHIGANSGQERELNASKGLPVLWIEPIPDIYEKLVSNLRNFPNQQAVQALLYDRDGVQSVPIRKVVRLGCFNCAPLCSLQQFWL
jgi:hypothetical protein